MSKKVLNIRVVDWYNEDNEKNFYENHFIKILQKYFEVRYSTNPDYIFYGPFGFEHLKYECIRIYWTGENVRANFNIADYAISFDYMDFGDRHLRLPLCFSGVGEITRIKVDRVRERFCSFLVTNPSSPRYTPRNLFFDKLCEYKKVDSGGRYKNNIGGGAIGDRYNDFQSSKHKWLQHYKFNICFENASYNGYLTEKLFDAFAAGCIPIYWGDTSLILDSADSSVNVESKNIESNFLLKPDYQINPKAFINIHKFASLEDAIDEIKRIDNDDNAYLEMANENVFLGDFSPNVYERRLEGFLLNIFNQNLQNAFRRGVSALYDNEMRYRKMAATFEGKSKRVKKLIRFICNITKTKKAFWG